MTGCAAQMSIMTQESLEGIDLIVPNPKKLDTLQEFLSTYPELAPQDRPQLQSIPSALGRTRATVKIQDGCNVFCSYCSIPFTRPGMSSRPAREIVSECQRLVEQGFHEVVLTGVLIGEYGESTGSGGPGFEELVAMISAESGVSRIRISSIEMHQVTEPIVQLVLDGKVVPHFHIPLQSGNSTVLRDMNRRYDQAQYIELCKRLQREIPDLSLTTDILVGFPTETEECFQSSIFVLEEVKFLKVHVFRFSTRPGTPADQWGDPISVQEKQRRAKILADISQRTGHEHVQKFVGQTREVLVEGKIAKDGILEGLTDNWITVKFAGAPSLARTLQKIHLSEVHDGIAFGELASEPFASRTQIKLY